MTRRVSVEPDGFIRNTAVVIKVINMIWPVEGPAIANSFKRISRRLPWDPSRPSLQELLHRTPLGARPKVDRGAKQSHAHNVGATQHVAPTSSSEEPNHEMVTTGSNAAIPTVRKLHYNPSPSTVPDLALPVAGNAPVSTHRARPVHEDRRTSRTAQDVRFRDAPTMAAEHDMALPQRPPPVMISSAPPLSTSHDYRATRAQHTDRATSQIDVPPPRRSFYNAEATHYRAGATALYEQKYTPVSHIFAGSRYYEHGFRSGRRDQLAEVSSP